MDKHIDLINTLGDMLEQTDESKMEKFILYSHIAHSNDKEETDIPQPFKGAQPKQPKLEVKEKANSLNKTENLSSTGTRKPIQL